MGRDRRGAISGRGQLLGSDLIQQPVSDRIGDQVQDLVQRVLSFGESPPAELDIKGR